MAIDDIHLKALRVPLDDAASGAVGGTDTVTRVDRPAWRPRRRPLGWQSGGHVADESESRLALLAYEIHDGLAQHMAGAQMRLETLLETDPTLTDHGRREIEASLALVQKATCEARHLIRGLRPPAMAETDVVAAVERLIEELPPGGPAVELLREGLWEPVSEFLEDAVFRIVQEALTNAARHSRSDRVVVRMMQTEELIELEIRDWGVGFDTTRTVADSYGLRGLRERARLLGGRTTIESGPGEGTRVFVELPMARPARDKAQEAEWE